MQARQTTLVATTAIIVALGFAAVAAAQERTIQNSPAATAAETEHDKHVFVNNATTPAAVGGANGGIWRAPNASTEQTAPDQVSNGEEPTQTDGVLVVRYLMGLRGAESGSATPDNVTPPASPSNSRDPQMDGVVVLSAEQQADPLTDGLLVVRADETPPQADGIMLMRAMSGVAETQPGEAASAAEPDAVQSDQQEQAGLLVPAVQRVRESAARTSEADAQTDGLLIMRNSEEVQEARPGTGTLTLANGAQAVVPDLPVCAVCNTGSQPPSQQQAPAPNDPELPICGHCGADVAQASETEEQPAHPRRNFSISFGGITIGSGGVSVAAGDVNGDGRSSRRVHSPVRMTGPTSAPPASAPARAPR